MNQPSEPQNSETVENFKALGIIGAAAALGALLAYGSATLFGYEVTLVAMMVILFTGLAFDSTVIDALIPTILFGVIGYVALLSFPHLIPVGGALCGIALVMAFAAYKEKKERQRVDNAEE
jgi:hypothetical protein